MQQQSLSGAPRPTSAAVFQGVHLSWPFERRGRPFVVRLVEPREYRPADHAELFNAVMTDLLSPHRRDNRRLYADGRTPSSTSVRMVTFPEAFVPVDALANALSVFAGYGPRDASTWVCVPLTATLIFSLLSRFEIW